MEKMTKYIGTKIVLATPMTKQEYCNYRGWDVPEDEDPSEIVYLVEYEADPLSKINHPDHKGYITMSPKHVFDKAYKVCETYVDRLQIEKDDLELKITKLHKALIDKAVPTKSIDVLVHQLDVMQTYLHILEGRLQFN